MRVARVKLIKTLLNAQICARFVRAVPAAVAAAIAPFLEKVSRKHHQTILEIEIDTFD